MSGNELHLTVNGAEVTLPDDGSSLLAVLRERLGLTSVKDGCAPQGQCGCCTVLVDGQPRVSCVTPARRVQGRSVITLEGLSEADRKRWGEAFCSTGGSQCGFCTPGIIMRFEGLRAKGVDGEDRAGAARALQAHLCRCTGWQPVVDAWQAAVGERDETHRSGPDRDGEAAERRAEIEGGAPQRVGPSVALGQGGFADDTAPADALVAVPDGSGDFFVAESLAEAWAAAGKVQGRRTTSECRPPLALPDGDWVRTLRTSWVEPAYLETDASWCEPGGDPATPLANGGAFGGKLTSGAPAAARRLADEHGRAVRVVMSREDVVRLGPKRPPVAAGMRADGSGIVRVVATPGIESAILAAASAGDRGGGSIEVVAVEGVGPPTRASLRAAGWAEMAVLRSGLADAPAVEIDDPVSGGWSRVEIASSGAIEVVVRGGDVLDAAVLRSYCLGAVHMGLGWVTSEGLAVDDAGEVHDLTIRSFGILRAVDLPSITVTVESDDRDPCRVSDAVFVATAAAVWRTQGFPPDWPTGRPPIVPR